jgi:tetratricopeptide (TPR) repeat protein
MTKIKIGRNDPCHCGSGQKYKRCCLEQDQRTDSAAFAQAAADRLAATSHHHHVHGQCDFCGDTFGDDDESDELTSASNAIVDMVRDGKLDEAEQAARDFLVRFPEVHDGYDRLGMVYEARGDHKQAAHYYRQVIDFVRAHPDQYEPAFETTFQRLVQKLDPPATARVS